MVTIASLEDRLGSIETCVPGEDAARVIRTFLALMPHCLTSGFLTSTTSLLARDRRVAPLRKTIP